jgi:hypothetical protein
MSCFFIKKDLGFLNTVLPWFFYAPVLEEKCIRYVDKSKVKQSSYTPWRHLGGEEV